VENNKDSEAAHSEEINVVLSGAQLFLQRVGCYKASPCHTLGPLCMQWFVFHFPPCCDTTKEALTRGQTDRAAQT
jgi:hypothetical protein